MKRESGGLDNPGRDQLGKDMSITIHTEQLSLRTLRSKLQHPLQGNIMVRLPETLCVSDLSSIALPNSDASDCHARKVYRRRVHKRHGHTGTGCCSIPSQSSQPKMNGCIVSCVTGHPVSATRECLSYLVAATLLTALVLAEVQMARCLGTP